MAGTPVAGEQYESITGQLFEIGRQLRQKGGYPFDPEKLKKILQDVIEGRFEDQQSRFEWLMDPKSKNEAWIDGFDPKESTRRGVSRCLSLEDEVVKSWINDPSSYPEGFRSTSVQLNHSRRLKNGHCFFATLYWHEAKKRIQIQWECYHKGGWMALGE